MKSKLSLVAQYIFLAVFAFISVFPFYWMIVGATNKSADITMGKLSFGDQLVENFNKLITVGDLPTALKNSIIISVVMTAASILLCSWAGYAFVIYETRAKNRVFYMILLSMMIPTASLMIPLFVLFSKLGLANTKLAVIIPGLATAFLIFFFRQNSRSFPYETIQAARIDGLSEFGIFFRIYFPMMKPTYAAAAIITFMSAWNSYLWPLVILQTPDQRTLPLLIGYLGSAYAPDFGTIMVGIVISTIPSAVIFFLMQKNFVNGMMGSVK